MPSTSKAAGGGGGEERKRMGAINRGVIGPAGRPTVVLCVTSTTGYGERQQWGGKVQA